jgi:hypothetical protein
MSDTNMEDLGRPPPRWPRKTFTRFSGEPSGISLYSAVSLVETHIRQITFYNGLRVMSARACMGST